jgi:hypothetical protein
MSPVRFRPAFDGIPEAWLNRQQDSGGVPSLGYPSKWADSRMPLPESATSTANAETKLPIDVGFSSRLKDEGCNGILTRPPFFCHTGLETFQCEYQNQACAAAG